MSNNQTQLFDRSEVVARPRPDRPAVLTGYELAEEVGRGAMGVVYRAHDLAMNREVAVKILLDRYDPISSIAGRFVAEAQITGQLQHPGIPAVYRVGHQADGRPFLAMKLIKGRTLDGLLKSGRTLNAPAVFEAIAQAVGYAHAHGVIHRDLKPANVMVGGFGEIQVMDWGLAKVLADRPATSVVEDPTDPEATVALPTEIRTLREDEGRFTQAGSVLGTPAYMAPEQAAGEVEKVDRRSDVFGLGAILCALLTGKPPYTGPDAESVRLAAVRGRTEDAFTRLDASGAEPDLVALCKRCLSFEPSARPADASAVAGEIAGLRAAADDRARQAELARARAEVQAEEQRKRRRVVLAAAAGAAAVLLLGIAGTTLGLIRADRAGHDAQAASGVAEASLAETRAVLDFVESRVFAAARPKGQQGGLGPDVPLRRAIEAAVPSVEGSFRDRPLIEARLRQTLGRSFLYLGEAEAARAMFQRAREIYRAILGPDHPDTLTSMANLAISYSDLGRHADALKLHEEVLNADKRVLPSGHPDTLSSMNNLAISYSKLGRHADALKLREEVLATQKRVLPTGHPDTLSSMNNLAISYSKLGRHADALKLHEEVVIGHKRVLPPDHPDTLTSMANLANSNSDLGRHADALKLHEEVLDARRRVLPPDHPDTLSSMNNLAISYSKLGRHADALKLREEVLATQKRVLPPGHPDTLGSMSNLANSYAALGRHSTSLKLEEEVLASQKRVLPPGHPDTLGSMSNLANSYAALGRQADARKLHEEVLDARKRVLPPDHPDTLSSMANLANSYAALGRQADALKLREEVLAAQKRVLPPGHPDTLGSMANLAASYAALGRHADSLKLEEEVLDARKRVLPPGHPDTLTSMNNLAMTYSQLNRHSEAVDLVRDAVARAEVVLGKAHPRTLFYMWTLVESLFAAGRSAEAVPLIDECVRRASGKDVDPDLVPEVMRFRLRHFREAADPAGCRATAAIWEARNRTDAASLYEAARHRAVAASVFAGAGRPDEATADADRAMAWLRKAVNAGFKGRERLKKDKDLDALRPRADFRELFESLPK